MGVRSGPEIRHGTPRAMRHTTSTWPLCRGNGVMIAPAATAQDPPAGQLPYGGRLMFTQSWEDPACDRRALRPSPGETIFAITSGGDNVLEFLLTDPEQV